MKIITTIIFTLIFGWVSILIAQVDIDIVYLKNGSIIRGKIIEQIPNQSIKIKTRDGSIFVYKMDEITKITKETVEDEDSFDLYKTPQTKGILASINGGIGVPVGGKLKNYLIGYTIGANIGAVLNNTIAIRFIDFSYSNFSYNFTTQAVGYETGTGGSFTLLSFGADFMVGDFNKKSRVVPYAFVGPRGFSKSIEDVKISTPYYWDYTIQGNSEVEFGLALGGGINFKVYKNIGIFTEVQFNIGFGNEPVTQIVPVKAGVLYSP